MGMKLLAMHVKGGGGDFPIQNSEEARIIYSGLLRRGMKAPNFLINHVTCHADLLLCIRPLFLISDWYN